MKKIILILFLLTLICIPDISLAQQDQGLIFNNPVPGLGDSPQNVTGLIIQRALGIIGVIAILLFIYAGFVWMTAQGDANKIKTAQQIMFWAAIGLLVIFGSYAMLSLVFGII